MRIIGVVDTEARVSKEISLVILANDEEALMAAIAAAPFDDAPRLVYADWLQERGDEAKAEYLRTVVRLMHPPEDRRDVDRCVALAEGLDEKWRQQVGGRFEVMAGGNCYAWRSPTRSEHSLKCFAMNRSISEVR